MSQIASFYLIKNNRRQELSNGDCSGAVYMAIWDWCESVLDFTLPSQVREFFLLTAGIQASTGVILSLSGMFDLTIHGERYCVLGEFWKEADGDQLLLRPREETIWYYAHEQDKVKRLCSDMAELLEKKLARYLNEK